MTFMQRMTHAVRPLIETAVCRWLAYLALCAAYLQGGINKLMDFQGAISEMNHFGLSPAPLFAALVIALELGGPIMILVGYLRWLASMVLSGFTLVATFLALRFWEFPAGMERLSIANSFSEHLGLCGGFLLIAWLDLREKFLISNRVDNR